MNFEMILDLSVIACLLLCIINLLIEKFGGFDGNEIIRVTIKKPSVITLQETIM